jgi:FkbM family methyltransferase
MSWRRPVRLMARRIARRQGYDVVEYPAPDVRRRLKLLRHFNIDLVLDVGADTGQYVRQLRRCGYAGRVVSFEPLAGSFGELRAAAADDSRWDVVNMALGARDGPATLHVAANSHSSSLREVLPAHLRAAPQSCYVGAEQVEMRRLDAVFAEYRGEARRVYLKIDVQGAEHEVLAGATEALRHIMGVQLEMSLVPLYAGQALMPELLTFLSAQGFALMSLEPGFTDPRTGRLLQVDGVFFRDTPPGVPAGHTPS